MDLTPDLEAAAIRWVSVSVDVPVATKVPHPRPDSFVRILLAGAERRQIVFVDAQLTVECWATSSVDAFRLASRVEGRLGEWPGQTGPTIYDVGSDGLINFPDESMSPRYMFTANVVARVEHAAA